MHNIFGIKRIDYYQWPLTLDAQVTLIEKWLSHSDLGLSRLVSRLVHSLEVM